MHTGMFFEESQLVVDQLLINVNYQFPRFYQVLCGILGRKLKIQTTKPSEKILACFFHVNDVI